MLDEWEIVIGLEVHAQIITYSKLFSESSTKFGEQPNANVSFFDASMPGVLPRLNEYAITQGVKTGLALEGKINLISAFDRKNYFYADLPLGYQITQFFHPLIDGGKIDINLPNNELKSIRLHHIHLEQDAGKSLHDQSPTESFIDLNRAGIALMEIVSEPDMRSSDEAIEYLKKLRTILRYIGTCDGDMEKGSFRCDANVSVRKIGADLGTRCEIKNLNSFKNIAKAIEYEAQRQIELLEQGEIIQQETRLYDVDANVTRTMRSKEDAFDYRYFPDPDLLPLHLTQKFIDDIAATLPELPEQKKARYVKEYSLSTYDSEILTNEKSTSVYFEEVVKHINPKLAANWIMGELFAYLNKNDMSIENSPIGSQSLIELLKLVEEDKISNKIAKDVFEKMFTLGKSANQIVDEDSLLQVSNPDEINLLIDDILLNNQEKLQEYRAGKDKLFGFFVGQAMKASHGKANPELLNQLLKEALSK